MNSTVGRGGETTGLGGDVLSSFKFGGKEEGNQFLLYDPFGSLTWNVPITVNMSDLIVGAKTPPQETSEAGMLKTYIEASSPPLG